MKKAIRRFIVRHFALYYKFRVLGVEFTALRCTRIMGPYFLIMACLNVFDPAYPRFQWWDIAMAAGFAFMVWLTFPWFGLGYFERWPVYRDELDEEQKAFYDWYVKNNP